MSIFLSRFLLLTRLIAVAGLAASCAAPAQALPLVDSHGRNGVSCTSCHGDAKPARKPDQATCLKCHESVDELIDAARRYVPNPHQIHLDDLECGQCHSMHVEKKTDCQRCHPARAMKKS